jgi:tripartite-type tricarboxylate transporter receptor subunit TctC
MVQRVVMAGRSLPRAIAGAVLVVGLAACGGGSGGQGGSGSEGAGGSFYQGETIDLVVPYDPGGGYDVYARAIAPYLGECLDAEVVVKNEPGAGGLLATNATAVADPEDPRLLVMNTAGFAAAQIADAEGVQYDLAEFSHVGRISGAPSALVVASDSDIASFDDISESTEPVRFVATGPGSEGYIVATALAEAYGFPLEVVTGFAGSGEARNAVVAGDAHVMALAFDSLLGPIRAGEVRPVVLVDEQANELLPGTPAISDFEAPDEQAQGLVDNLVDLGESGRSIAAPPGLPEDRLSELRGAFTCALENEKLLSELESQQRPVDVVEGEKYAQQVRDVLDASPEFEAALKQSF